MNKLVVTKHKKSFLCIFCLHISRIHSMHICWFRETFFDRKQFRLKQQWFLKRKNWTRWRRRWKWLVVNDVFTYCWWIMSKQELIAWTVGSLSNAQRTVKGYCLHITLKLFLCQKVSTLLCLLLILMSAFALKILFVFQKKKKRKKAGKFSFFNCPWNWRKLRGGGGKYKIKEAAALILMLFNLKGTKRSLTYFGRLIILFIFSNPL